MRHPHLSLLLLLGSTLSVFGAAVTTPAPPASSDFIITSIWVEGGPLQGGSDVSLHLTLKSKDLPGLAVKMEQISLDNQGKWLSEADLDPLVRPSSETIKAVMDVLHQSGVPDKVIIPSKFGDRLTVTLPTARVLKLFENKFWTTNVAHDQFDKVKKSIQGSAGPPLKTFTSGSLSVVQDAPTKREIAKRGGALPAGCDEAKVTPACLKEFYGLSGLQAFQTNDGKPDVVTVSDSSHPVVFKDIDDYIKKYIPDQAGYKLTVDTAPGVKNDEGKADSEGVYLTQALIGMIAPMKVNYYMMDTNVVQVQDYHETFINHFIDEYSDKTRPKILSIPYSSYETYSTEAQVKTMCNAAMKLSALGTTIVAPAGEHGVGSEVGTCPYFKASYPSGCPYIVSVGFTQGLNPEIMYNGSYPYGSSSGTSNVFTTPAYQADKLSAYEKTIAPSDKLYNMSGRAYPDMVAAGKYQTHIFQGKEVLITGAGSGVQTASSILAWVNNKRAEAGKGQLGYIQPALYKYGVMNDITVGGSYACQKAKPTLGLAAGPGYDIASGLGSPRFDVISKALGV